MPNSGCCPTRRSSFSTLVADIERYPEFLPWCVGARIRERRGNEIRRRSDHRLQDGPRALHLARRARPGPTASTSATPKARSAISTTTGFSCRKATGGCRIDFFVDFEFQSRMLQKIIEMLFSEAVRRMVGAFEARAHQLYGEAKI